MKSKSKPSRSVLSRSIASAFGLSAAVSGAAYAADAADPGATLPEITVTAQRRAESIQDVPITVQAITFDQLRELSITSIDDAIKYLPNVSLGSNGPGQGTIFMRGLSAGAQGGQSSATIAPFPNVALYVDDQSMQFPGRNVDVYLVDMERIEVLEGPQGTLFGGGAQAGVVRYVTNKPKLGKSLGDAEAGYGVTAGGAPNSKTSAMLNLPFGDNLAIRGVVYDDHRGGYISNVASNFTYKNTDPGIAAYSTVHPTSGSTCPNGLPSSNGTASGACVPLGTPVGNNLNLVNSASNPVDYRGIRLSALYEINNNWEVLLSQTYQNMDSQGQFSQYPYGSDGQPLSRQQATVFSPTWDRDNYESTSWTLNGQIGDFKTVYTGSFMTRNIDNQADYSNYTRTAGGMYYTSTSPGGIGSAGKPSIFYNPITSWRDIVKNRHQSHELRLTTPDTWFIRGTGGVYWEDFKIFDVMNFNYKTVPSCTPLNLQTALAGGADCIANVATLPGTTTSNPGQRGDTTAFGEDAQRGYKQTALFGSFDYDILPKTLTLTAGTRYYHYDEYQVGAQYGTNTSCLNVPNGQCLHGVNMDAEGLNAKYNGFRSRLSLAWHPDTESMLYATWSQGFRPGAFNRSSPAGEAPFGGAKADKSLTATGYQYKRPLSYTPDQLTNIEAGYKASLLDHRVQLDATAYHMTWKNVQFLFFSPTQFSNTSFVTNGPDYTTNGVELQLSGKATRQLTLQGNASYNRAKESASPCLTDNQPTSQNFGQCITQIKGNAVANLYGQVGDTPPFSPTLQFSLRARYDWTIDSYKAFFSVGANHTGPMSNQPSNYPSGDVASQVPVPTTTLLRYEMPGYTLYDAVFGISKDNWRVQINGSNLGNSNASTFTNSTEFLKQEVPVRPRIIGLTIGMSF